MQSSTIQNLQQAVKSATAAKRLQNFPPLDQETRSHVGTACAAFHLNRKPNTLRIWSMTEAGALRPSSRLNGRLLWSVASIKRLLNGGQ